MTRIERAYATWNPVTGCTPVSPGCDNCYAYRIARRLAGRYGYPEAPHHFDVTVHENRLDKPFHWRKPRRVFVASMGDLFHEDVPETHIRKVWATMALASWHTFLVLTKRPQRMRYEMQVLRDLASAEQWTIAELAKPLPNVLLGVTVENGDYTWRIDKLLQIPAAGYFVSLEPLLSAVDLRHINCDNVVEIDALTGDHGVYRPYAGRSDRKLSLVVAGGESGPGARPTHPQWMRDVRDQCVESGTPFHFKGWGAWMPTGNVADFSDYQRMRYVYQDGSYAPGVDRYVSHGEPMHRVGKRAAGRLLDGREWNQFPEA
jgi:protein gp37